MFAMFNYIIFSVLCINNINNIYGTVIIEEPYLNCSSNEKPVPCINRCAPTCDNRKGSKICTTICEKGCECEDNYMRITFPDGACVPVDQCPTQECYDPNEEYTDCGSACPLVCNVPPPDACITSCVSGCFCKKPYIRDGTYAGKCVLPDECPPPPPQEECRDPHEEFNPCGTACPLTCNSPEPVPCTRQCVPGCFCTGDYIRDESSGKCVLPKKCPVQPPPEKCKDPREEYEECGSICAPTCTKPKSKICSDLCRPGCYCKAPYIRDESRAKCVLLEECPAPPAEECKDPNEEFTECATACPPTCDNPEPELCTSQCVIGCSCKAPYVRDESSGTCVLLEKCSTPPPEECKDPNEEFRECGTACPPTCDEPQPEICTKICVQGCFCKAPYVRDESSGTCVLLEECSASPPGECKDSNEEFKECGTACPPTCDEPQPKSCTRNCVQGCFCIEPYVRDESSGKCVLLDECPATPPPKQCKNPHEEYSGCGSACAPTCATPNPQVCSRLCVPGCSCKKPYVRDESSGKCVLLDECPNASPSEECKDPNEEYKSCGSACAPTCSNLKPEVCTDQCVSGCFCIKPYVRDPLSGKCVARKNCPATPPVEKCNDPNEEYTTCGSACPPTCTDPEPGVCTLQCVIGCFCKKGYVRNDRCGKCVPLEDCPAPPPEKCEDPNEEYKECGTACPLICGELEPEFCTEQCVSGCFCKKSYRSDKSTGKCVRKEKCPIVLPPPKCKDPKEEYKGCGSACFPTCDQPKPKICTDLCVPGCFCKEPYVRDESCGECVLLKKCPEKD